MCAAVSAPLFPWNALEDSSSLKTLDRFLSGFPDGRLPESLCRARGRGRNGCPPHVLWGVLLLSVALRHPSIESCPGELRRNRELRGLIGIESEGQVPGKRNRSRFLTTPGSAAEKEREEEQGLLQASGGRKEYADDEGRETAQPAAFSRSALAFNQRRGTLQRHVAQTA